MYCFHFLPASISEHHSQPEGSRLAPLISLGPSRPSGKSPNLQDFLCALEKRWQITRCQAKRRMSVSCKQARTPEHIEMSVNTRLGPPGSRGRGFLPMLNKARIQSFIITLFEYSPKEYLSLESAKCGCWLTLESRAVLPCPSRQS